jgi:hypothetical protein
VELGVVDGDMAVAAIRMRATNAKGIIDGRSPQLIMSLVNNVFNADEQATSDYYPTEGVGAPADSSQRKLFLKYYFK